MLDMPQKLELSIKTVLDAEGSTAQCFAGLSADDKVTPRAIITAQSGDEMPQGSGNYKLQVSVTVISNADDTTIEEHRALCVTLLGTLMEDDIASQLSSAVSDFHCFGFSNRGCRESVEDRAWVTEFTSDFYCAGLALV